jgi:hypothetical protein
MAMTPEEKLSRQVANALADFRFNEAHFASHMTKDAQISMRFRVLVETYIKIASVRYHYGAWGSEQEREHLKILNALNQVLLERDAL